MILENDHENMKYAPIALQLKMNKELVFPYFQQLQKYNHFSGNEIG